MGLADVVGLGVADDVGLGVRLGVGLGLSESVGVGDVVSVAHIYDCVGVTEFDARCDGVGLCVGVVERLV